MSEAVRDPRGERHEKIIVLHDLPPARWGGRLYGIGLRYDSCGRISTYTNATSLASASQRASAAPYTGTNY